MVVIKANLSFYDKKLSIFSFIFCFKCFSLALLVCVCVLVCSLFVLHSIVVVVFSWLGGRDTVAIAWKTREKYETVHLCFVIIVVLFLLLLLKEGGKTIENVMP